MKASKKRFLAILLIAVMLMTTGCGITSIGGASEIETVVSQFQYSCQHLDLEGMLECINPDVAGPVRFVLNIFMWFTKSEPEDVVVDIMENVFDNQYDIPDVFDDITFVNPKIKIRGNEATAEYTLEYAIGSAGIKEQMEELKQALYTLQSSEEVSEVKNIINNAENFSGCEFYDELDTLGNYKFMEGIRDTNISTVVNDLEHLERIEIPVTFMLISSDGKWYISGIKLGAADDSSTQ